MCDSQFAILCRYPVLSLLAFLELLVFFPPSILICLSAIPFFFRDFRGSVGIKILVFWWFSCLLPKVLGKEGQGKFWSVFRVFSELWYPIEPFQLALLTAQST